MSNWVEREQGAIFQTYKRLPIVIDKAEGVWIYSKDGKKYLDFLAGIAVNTLGHSHQKVINAIETQIRNYMHVSNYFYQVPQIELAETLKEISNFSKVFFTNSGTEAVEGAIKLARRWGASKNKINIIGFSGGFHGRTYGPLSVMDKPLYKDKMGPFLSNMKVIEYNNSAMLEATINDATAAIILEFVQGEGGVSSVTSEFVEKINELKAKYGFLVIADEIQTGIGRTGKYFGFENWDIKPDVVTSAKALGGGLPLGALLAVEDLKGIWDKGMHGTTYGGNAVAAAAGKVVIDELKQGLLNQVNEIGGYLKNRLNQIKSQFPDLIIEIRGFGLMQGILLSGDATWLMNELLERGVITNVASGNVLRLVPPLIVNQTEVDIFIDALVDSLKTRTA